MTHNHFKSLKIVLTMTAILLLSACNGKVDQDLIDSITGKISVVQVIIDQADFTMKVGESTQLTAKVLPEDATDKTVAWSSSNEAVVMISSSGKAKAEGPGEATITAKAGSKIDFITITVEGGSQPVSTETSVTVGYEKVSAVSVVLKGKANLSPTVPLDLTLGFQYKKDSEQLAPVIKVNATGYDKDYNYSVNLIDLEPGSVYSFRSFVTQDGKDAYGETMSFTTKDIASIFGTRDASEVADCAATLNGKLDLTDVQYKNVDYGFYWGTSELVLNTYAKGGLLAENAYSAPLANLFPETQYWYKAYLKLDNQTFYGDVKSFTTLWNPVTEVTLDKTEYVFHSIGASLTLSPTVSPSDASDKSVSWKSSDDSVAKVAQNGKVTAKGNGSAIITVTTNDQSKTATCEITVAQWITSITLDKSALVLTEGASGTVSVASITPENANDKSVTWESDNTLVAKVDKNGKVTAVANGTTTIKATANDGSGKSSSCSVEVYKIPDAVDLGLSVKWGSFNFGASSPEEYGLYYAWGEIESKTVYSWYTYKWCNGSINTLTKYNYSFSYGFVDSKTVLDADDDVAHVKLGGSWRIPTDAEWTELLNNCEWIWTAMNGVNGRLVTSTKNGASIFLPAAGKRYDTSLGSVGSRGYYWSSSLYGGGTTSGANGAYFSSDKVNGGSSGRADGLSVRPVSD